MFLPNTYCDIHYRSDTPDVYSEYTYADPVTLPCSIVSLKIGVAKSSVRADSSASRGRAEEEIGTARLLFVKGTKIREGDIVSIDGQRLEVTQLFVRRDVLGHVDHIQAEFRKGFLPDAQ